MMGFVASEVERLVNNAYVKAELILNENIELLHHLANTFAENEEVTAKEFGPRSKFPITGFWDNNLGTEDNADAYANARGRVDVGRGNGHRDSPGSTPSRRSSAHVSDISDDIRKAFADDLDLSAADVNDPALDNTKNVCAADG